MQKQAAPLDPTDGSCLVIALAPPESLPKLRDALRAIHPISVTATAATCWGEQRSEQYRGASYALDEQVTRVEIACDERQVDSIVRAIGRALERESALEGAVIRRAPDAQASVHVAALSRFALQKPR